VSIVLDKNANQNGSARRRRALFWLPIAVVGIVALLWLFRPQPVPVDMARVERGAIEVTVSDEGETRVRDVFVVSAPVPGLMRRLDLRAGDPVTAQRTVIARIEPRDPSFLDARSETEARASVRSAQAELDFAVAERNRYRELAASNTVSANDLDAAERRARMAAAALDEARARLIAPAAGRLKRRSDCACVEVFSPVSGNVLQILRESEGVVEPGTALVTVGNPQDLEVVVDLLSADAVKIRPGLPVLIEAWGGGPPLNGKVRRVEPFGFTKVSALGIEEQRVNVIIDFTDPPESWSRLGHGFRVEPRIQLATAENVIKVPRAALFREAGQWAVFVNDAGRARLQRVQLGLENDLEAQVTTGVDEGASVVLQPGDRVSDGVRIRAR
jgi:HlyD family secretion protein